LAVVISGVLRLWGGDGGGDDRRRGLRQAGKLGDQESVGLSVGAVLGTRVDQGPESGETVEAEVDQARQRVPRFYSPVIREEQTFEVQVFE
jgi:hypothetical protein